MIPNCDMTVYNKYLVSGVDHYQRTQLKKVTWEDRKASNVRATGGTMEANQATVFIAFSHLNHLSPKLWDALTTKTGKWTLAEGDYIVKGLVLDEIGASFTLSALKAKYDSVLAIRSVDVRDEGSFAMRHWEVGAQ
jgi:hypothetical protein